MDNTSELLHELRAQAKAEEPAEKAKIVQDGIRTAQELQARGSDHVDGRGQAIGSIPPRLWFRWNNMLPGCWQVKEFVQEFLFDNPQYCAPGYKPPSRSLRHSMSFVSGQPLSAGAQFYFRNKDKVK